MITGSMDIIGVVKDLDIKNFITADELNILLMHQ
jgi:hypothetical protein